MIDLARDLLVAYWHRWAGVRVSLTRSWPFRPARRRHDDEYFYGNVTITIPAAWLDQLEVARQLRMQRASDRVWPLLSAHPQESQQARHRLAAAASKAEAMTVRRYSDGTVVSDRPVVACVRYKYETFQDAENAAKERSRGALNGFEEFAFLCPRCDRYHVDRRTAMKVRRARVRSLRQRRKAARKARG